MNSTESEAIKEYFSQKRLAYLPDAVVLKTIFGGFVAVNDTFARLQGIPPTKSSVKTGVHWTYGWIIFCARTILKSLGK